MTDVVRRALVTFLSFLLLTSYDTLVVDSLETASVKCQCYWTREADQSSDDLELCSRTAGLGIHCAS